MTFSLSKNTVPIFGNFLKTIFFGGLLCCLFAQQLAAQVILPDAQRMGVDTCISVKLEACGGTVDDNDLRWTDDGSNDGNYSDPIGQPRADTIEFCPIDSWHRVRVVFTEFDVATGDALRYYQGNKAAVRAGSPVVGSGSGVGVSQAFGGWVDASCSVVDNPSGCLTFVFSTNGDNRKGTGWDAWIDCQRREAELVAPGIRDYLIKDCQETFATVTFPLAGINADCTIPTSGRIGQIIRIKNQFGENICESRIMEGSTGPNTVGPFTVGIGQYLIEYKLMSDTTKTLLVPFAVQAPALVGNDDLNIPLSGGCAAAIKPDDVLENPCDTIFKTLYYDITVTIPGAHGFKDVVLRSSNVLDTTRETIYPIVTADDIRKAGQKICDVMTTVQVDRIYYPFGQPAGIQKFSGRVTSSVSTRVKLLDQQQPWIDVKDIPDTLVACDTTGLAHFLDVAGVDNCDDDLDVEYTVRYTETDPCFANLGTPDVTTVFVDFTATDDCGNVGRATKSIVFLRPNLRDPQFIAKTETVRVDCNATADFPKPGVKIGPWINGRLDPNHTKVLPLNTETYVCGYILTEHEEEVPSTDCGRKRYVYYSVVDWCVSTGSLYAIDTSLVETTDTLAPEFIEGAGQPLTVELGHFDCTFDANNLPKPKATDNCDTNPTVRIGGIARIDNGKIQPLSLHLTELACDSFRIRWIATDDCHEQLKNDTLDQIVVIQDVTKPSAVCVDQLNVTIPDEFGARVYAEDVDAGSFDACGIASRLIRIKGSDDAFAEFVNIECQYVHPNVQLELQVSDHKGNVNLCWIDVEVEDKISPICQPLLDVIGDCEDYHTGDFGATTDADDDGKMEDSEYVDLTDKLLAVINRDFGDPFDLTICRDNLGKECGVLDFDQQYQLLAWPCGEYKIKRRYRAKDWSGNVSAWYVQNITIQPKQTWSVTLPADWEGGCGAMPPMEDISIGIGACDLLAYEVTERQFDVPGDACFKIERTYHIINWCKYEAGTNPVEIARIEGDHGFADSLVVTSEGNEDIGYWT
ncbi:MAG: hypothetical protein AAGJ18_10375, partial [Bacteroidota bacterium]